MGKKPNFGGSVLIFSVGSMGDGCSLIHNGWRQKPLKRFSHGTEQHQRHGKVADTVQQVKGDTAYPPGDGGPDAACCNVNRGAQQPEQQPKAA